jgi:DHA1 family bicyclomycin/chloramphenicol resistance-like MFS transporter
VIFIIVPAIAPALGQGILALSNWKSIFYVFILLGLLCYWLLYTKQKETLLESARIPFSIKNLKMGVVETLSNKYSRNYTIASGFTSGAFVGYLATSQQILQVQFNLGDQFSLYFGVLAIFIGLSSFVNSRLVLKHGLYKLSFNSLIALFSLSVIYLVSYLLFSISDSLNFFMLYLCSSFLFIGVLFGNLSTLAIEPLGHIAGVANSVISSIQTFISVIIGAVVGSLYTDNVLPLVLSFMFMSLFALIIFIRTKQEIYVPKKA